MLYCAITEYLSSYGSTVYSYIEYCEDGSGEPHVDVHEDKDIYYDYFLTETEAIVFCEEAEKKNLSREDRMKKCILEERNMKEYKFISFGDISDMYRYEKFYDENGVMHNDNRFIGIYDNEFYYCDSTTGKLTPIDLYDEEGKKINFDEFYED